MFDLLKNQAGLCKLSDEAVANYDQILQAKRNIAPDPALRMRIEDAWTRLTAAKNTGADMTRCRDLESRYRELKAAEDAARRVLDDELKTAEDAVRVINDPFIARTKQWLREIIKIQPEPEFAEFAMSAVREVGAMGLRPLSEILKATEKCRRIVAGWKFEKPDRFLPELTFQAVELTAC
jgi:hypothetical protein